MSKASKDRDFSYFTPEDVYWTMLECIRPIWASLQPLTPYCGNILVDRHEGRPLLTDEGKNYVFENLNDTFQASRELIEALRPVVDRAYPEEMRTLTSHLYRAVVTAALTVEMSAALWGHTTEVPDSTLAGFGVLRDQLTTLYHAVLDSHDRLEEWFHQHREAVAHV